MCRLLVESAQSVHKYWKHSTIAGMRDGDGDPAYLRWRWWGSLNTLGLSVIIPVTWPVQCSPGSLLPCSPHSSHTRKTLSRSRIRPPGRLGWLVPRYRNNAYSRSWPLPTAGPWACPGLHSPHSVSQMRLCALLVIIGSVFSQKLPFVGNIK